MEIQRLGRTFFAEVRGVSLGAGLRDSEFADIHQALLDHGVLAFPGQHLDDAAQVAFSERFGPLEDDLLDPTQHVAFMSNLEADGSFRDPDSRLSLFMRSNQQWHSDSTFLEAPAKISLLSGRRIPEHGGATEFADMQAAWEALPESRRATLDGLVVVHDFQNSRRRTGLEFTEEERRRWPPLMHPLVRRHEDTGAAALYVGSQADHILGMDRDAGAAILAELIEFATGRRFTHAHSWTAGDLVVWDNRRVNHRGRPWPEASEPRVLHRTTVRGTGPTMDGGIPVDEYARARAAA